MDRRVIRWGLAAGSLLGAGTGLLLFWASSNAPLLAACFFLAALTTGLGFLSRALTGDARKAGSPAFDSCSRHPRS